MTVYDGKSLLDKVGGGTYEVMVSSIYYSKGGGSI